MTVFSLSALAVATAGLMAAVWPVRASAAADSVPASAVTPANAAYAQGAYDVSSVRFTSGGVELAGLLYQPAATGRARPGVVLLGPFGFVKEQAPMQYATRLARDGYATLIFDPRYSGESGGQPRRLESPKAKIEDVKAALDFLQAQPHVDKNRLAALGICQGSSEMLAVAAQDPRVKVLATVSGQYIYPHNIDGFFSQSGMTREQRMARGQAALENFRKTGAVDYTEVVSLTDKSVGLPWKPIHDWYQPWTTERWMKPSRWENRYATMSDAEVWRFNVDDYAVKVKAPTLIVHGEMSDGNVEAAQHVFDLLPVKDKQLIIVPGVFHTRFYDDPAVIDPAAAQVSQWFARHLR